MHKKGFTLVEVALFLALSGALVLIVIGGTTRSIAEKRFNDTVDNFVSYLEGLYASVNYARYSNANDNKQAVYGKLVNMVTDVNKTTFTSYTVIAQADAKRINISDALKAISELEPKLLPQDKEEYHLSWSGWATAQEINEQLQILLLIIRHPKNGMITTYVYYPPSNASPINIEAYIGNLNNIILKNGNEFNFKQANANFCIDSDDRWAAGNERRLVRIHSGANNASGVELMSNQKKEGLCED